jgi:hypothetical protein
MAFVTGLMGPYMSPIPINASMGMFISLAIAFVITPWLALKLMKPAAHGHDGHGGDATTEKLDRLFRRIMTPLLDPRTGRRGAAQAVDRRPGRDPGLGQPRLRQAGGAEDAALRQQERIPGRARHAGRHAAGRNREGAARDLGRDRPGARSRRLPGLRRHRSADQLQRTGAPVLPAQRAGNGRHPGQPRGQEASRPPEPRDRRLGARARGRRGEASTAAMPRWWKCRPARR